MTEEIKEMNLSEMLFNRDERLLNYITNLQKENTDLKKLCDKYEEEHKTTFETWKKVIARNEKAIESIEDCKKVNGDEHTCIIDHNYLLNILQGGNE